MKAISLLILFCSVVCAYSVGYAYDENGSYTFDELCKRGADGFPEDSDLVNCWGFEKESDIFYNKVPNTCTSDSFLSNHPNGSLNSEPTLNASVNTSTCEYPVRDPNFSTSGNNSMNVYQVDYGGGNSAGTFKPWFKHYIGSDGRRKFVAFGRGGEFWIHYRYRQDQNLFQYQHKRFMVTHRLSYYEHVLNAADKINSDSYNYDMVCAYAFKGSTDHGCSQSKRWEANKWHTIVMHIRIGDGSDIDSDGFVRAGGLFELYMDGELAIKNENFRIPDAEFPNPYNVDLDYQDERDQYGFFRLDFLLFENGKNTSTDTSPDRPRGNMWIDDVIVSRKPIPIIIAGDNSDNIAPNPPSGLEAD